MADLGGTGVILGDGQDTGSITELLTEHRTDINAGGGGGAAGFTDLGDVPASYSGQGSKLVAVKAAADGLEFVNAPSGTSIYAASVASVAALKALDMTDYAAGDLIHVTSYVSGTYYGGGTFVVDDTTQAADSGMLIAPTTPDGNKKYRRLGVPRGQANVLHFGARPTGSASQASDNTTAFQAAIDYLEARSNDTYLRGYALVIPHHDKAYYLSSELIVTSQVGELQIIGTGGRANLVQADTKGYFIFTRENNDTDSTTHRHIVVENIFFNWTTTQALSNVRANVFSWTNYPDDTGGNLYGFTCRNCEFRNGRRVFTLVDQTQPEAPPYRLNAELEPVPNEYVGAFYLQSVSFEYCHYHGMSGALYHINIKNAGGPQLTIRNITTSCLNLVEQAIYVQHAHSVVIDQIEFLYNQYRCVFLGNCMFAQISNITIEKTEMSSTNEAFFFESGGSNPWIWNVRWINDTITSTKYMVSSYDAVVRMSGTWDVSDITHSGGGTKLILARVTNNGTVYWDGHYKFDGAKAQYVKISGATDVVLWEPDTITGG